jgi:hypothetical protein
VRQVDTGNLNIDTPPLPEVGLASAPKLPETQNESQAVFDAYIENLKSPNPRSMSNEELIKTYKVLAKLTRDTKNMQVFQEAINTRFGKNIQVIP